MLQPFTGKQLERGERKERVNVRKRETEKGRIIEAIIIESVSIGSEEMKIRELVDCSCE